MPRIFAAKPAGVAGFDDARYLTNRLDVALGQGTTKVTLLRVPRRSLAAASAPTVQADSTVREYKSDDRDADAEHGQRGAQAVRQTLRTDRADSLISAVLC